MSDHVPEAQRLMQQDGICTVVYRTADDHAVICLQERDTCSLHSERAILRRQALPVVEALRKYEDEHGDVRDGWICLSKALDAADAAMEGGTPHGDVVPRRTPPEPDVSIQFEEDRHV